MDYDVIVVGGGLTGASILRDCALRGLRSLLVEARDLGAGASGVRDGLLDAGPAPLTPSRRRRVEAELGALRWTGGHLLRTLPLLWPLASHATGGSAAWLRARASAVAARAPRRHADGGFWASLDAEELRALEPALGGQVAGAKVTAAWHVIPQRLIAQQVRGALEVGADVLCGAEVVGLRRASSAVSGVEVVEARTGERRGYDARVVVNAAGARADEVAALCDQRLALRRVGLVGVKLPARPLFSAVVLGAAAPGARLVGDADGAYIGPVELDAPAGVDEEGLEVVAAARALLAAARDLIPAIGGGRLELRRALAARELDGDDGVGSTPARWSDHGALGAPGLISAWGGAAIEKRWLAEQVVDVICGSLAHEAPCRTAFKALPSDEGMVDPQRWSEQYAIALDTSERLCRRHGAQTHEILQRGETSGGLGLACRCQAVCSAELRLVMDREAVDGLDALGRRTGLGRGPCQGARCLARAGRVAARARGWTPARHLDELRQAKEARFAAYGPLLDGEQAATFAIDQLVHRLSANLDQLWGADGDAQGDA